MNWRETIRSSFAALGRPADADVVEELAQHAEAAVAAARADGLSADEADARVLGLVDGWCRGTSGGPRRVQRPPLPDAAPAGPAGLFAGLGLDLRYSLRGLRRRPGAALVAIVTMALGIGAATTLFSLTYNVLLKPLPWPDADRLVQVTETHPGSTRVLGPLLTNASYLAWQDSPSTITGLAAWDNDRVTIKAGDGSGEPERVKVIETTASLFTILDAHPLLGRPLVPADDAPDGGAPVAVLSYSAWQLWFGGRADITSQWADIDGVHRQIVGVMPAPFAFPDRDAMAWLPRHVPAVKMADGGSAVSLFNALARLRPGVTAEQASAEATARAQAGPSLGMVGVAVFGTTSKAVIAATPLMDALTADVRPAILVLLAAVGLLLVAAVMNVASMQLAHAAARRREVALRAALGGGAGRIARQLFVENGVIAVTGGAAGLALAVALHQLLPRLLPADFPRLEDVTFGWPVAAFAVAASLAASLVFGALPTLLARRLNLVAALTEDSLAPVGARLRTRVARTRAAIMAAQVAVAAILLVGAALIGRSFVGLLHADRGFQPANLLTAQLPLPDRQYTGPQRAALVDALLDRLRRTPGVSDAAATSILPLIHTVSLMSFPMPSHDPRQPQVMVQTAVSDVSPGYFAAMGTRVVEGRAFLASDTTTSEPVMIVNQAFERTYLNGHALDAMVPAGFSKRADHWRVVGVVEDVHQQDAAEPTHPSVFVSYGQLTEGLEAEVPVIALRTTRAPSSFVPTLRGIVRDQDPGVALQSVMTMEDRLSTSLARPRLYAVVLVGFGGFALLLAAVGLFGVLSYMVAQRAREMGVRAALGARPADLVRLVVGQGLAVTVVGAGVGLAAAYALARYASSLLYGVTAHDALTFSLVPVCLVVVALAACYWPARRAASIDPLRAMKS